MYRGGNCTFTAQYLRCAARYWEGPELRATLLGFRTARSLVQ
jgi:formylglycine-generating enzyme required for sulfatase activity